MRLICLSLWIPFSVLFLLHLLELAASLSSKSSLSMPQDHVASMRRVAGKRRMHAPNASIYRVELRVVTRCPIPLQPVYYLFLQRRTPFTWTFLHNQDSSYTHTESAAPRLDDACTNCAPFLPSSLCLSLPLKVASSSMPKDHSFL